MGIRCSENQISDFISQVGNLNDYCFFNMGDFDLAIDLLSNKCELLIRAGENNFQRIHNSISEAEHVIDHNEKAIEHFNGQIDIMKKVISKTQDEQTRQKLLKVKSNMEKDVARMIKANQNLIELHSKLQTRADKLSRSINNVREISYNVAKVKSDLAKIKNNFSNELSAIKSNSNVALMCVKKINECLSDIAKTSNDCSKIIAIKNSNYLFNMANSLNGAYQAIADSDSDYARLLTSFASVIQDEVSKGIAAESQEMLDKFNYGLKDFPSMSVKFTEAGNALNKYLSIKM